MTETVQADVTGLAVTLLSAYVSNNTVPAGELAGLIESTRKALIGEVAPAETAPQEFVPATTVRKSLASREHILSMIDGKPYKTLKRHLGTHGLTPAEYRARYNLAHDYPLVAPAYSEARRETARTIGLGRKPAVKAEATSAPAAKVTSAPTDKAKAAAKPVRAKAKAPTSAVKAEAAASVPAETAPKAKASPKAKATGPAKVAKQKAQVTEAKADAVAAAEPVTPKATAPAKAAAKPAAAAAAKKPAIIKDSGTAAAPKPRKKLGIVVPKAKVDAPKG